MLLPEEIEEEYDVVGKQVLTPDGWRDIKKVYKTVPLPVLHIKTSNYSLECSEHHMIKTAAGTWAEAIDLGPGDMILTESGVDIVLTVLKTGRVEPMYDITVDDPSGEFYSNGIVSHNSTTFAARQLILSHLIPGYKSLYICPQHDQLKTYARRYAEMEAAFRFNNGKQNVYNKVYSTRSTVEMNYCLTSANAVRGKSVIECLIDECVAWNTLLRTQENDTKVRICDVRIGDRVLAFNPVNNLVDYDTVIDKKYKGKRSCWRIKISSGNYIDATDNHRIYTSRGWLFVGELRDCFSGSRGIVSPPETISQVAEENNKEIIFTDIESIEYCGDVDVYDITTEKYNTFIANGIAVHNCQGMDPDIIPELLYVQTTAQYPSTIFAGTSLSIDTLLEAKWLASSQGMWHVRAGDGTHWLNMHDQDTLFKVCDNAKGPTCPYTGKLLNVRDGLYVHANKQALAVGAVGIHVPQCIIPDLAYNPIQWGKIYKKVRTDDPKKVMQECFGIAVAEGSREITESDLQRICVLTDTVEEAKQKCRNGYYKLVVSGCDWGGSDYNQAIKTKTSYTVHCILGVAPDDRVDILHYRRFAGMDYREIADIIATEHSAFNAHVIASDFGVGLAYNTEIRNRIPFDRHFIMNYVGPNSAPLATPKGQHMANQLALNKTEAITNVFSDLKSPHLKIRARHWEEMSPFLLDWLNMYRAPVENAIGSGTFKYIRSATKADDALHAFTFAYVLVKFFLGEPLVNDLSLQNKLRQVLNMGVVYSRDDLDVLTRNAPPDYIISG